MRYEYGDPGNPDSTLHGLNLSCRITRGKGQCSVDIADDQADKAIEHIDQMILWLETTRDRLILNGVDTTIAPDATFADHMAAIQERHRERYRRYLEGAA